MVNNFRIDWVNHTIGFLSALLGIYLAFQLENYGDYINDQEKIATVKKALRKEIEANLALYKTNIDDLSGWAEYSEFFGAKKDEKLDGLVIGSNELSIITKKSPTRPGYYNRFFALREIKSINDTLKVYSMNQFVLDVWPTPGFSTSNWRAALASGTLSNIDFSLTSNLTQIYDWIERDIGTPEKEIYDNLLGIRDNNRTDFKKLAKDYKAIASAYRLKRDEIEKILSRIKWD